MSEYKVAITARGRGLALEPASVPEAMTSASTTRPDVTTSESRRCRRDAEASDGWRERRWPPGSVSARQLDAHDVAEGGNPVQVTGRNDASYDVESH